MKSLALVSLLFAFACGDNGAAGTDAGVDTTSPTVDAAPAVPRAVAVAGDFSAPPGTIGALNVDKLTVQQGVIAGVVTDDPQLRKIGDTLYVINRDTNSVVGLDATTFAFKGQLGTGASSNPYDVAVVGETLYIPVLGGTGVVYGKLGDSTVTAIDLASVVGDPDGHPDCVSANTIGTDVYVTCEDLGNFSPRGNGVLVVIDSTTNTVRTHITLPAANPQPLAKMLGSDLIVLTFSYSNPTDGCTIKITPGTTPTAECLTQNSALGGAPISFDIAGSKLWFAYSNGSFTTPLSWVRAYDTTSQTYADKLTPDTQAIRDVAACPDGKVVVLDEGATTTASNGFRVYSGTTEVTSAALPLGIKPVFGNSIACY